MQKKKQKDPFVEEMTARWNHFWCGLFTGHRGTLNQSGTSFICIDCAKITFL